MASRSLFCHNRNSHVLPTDLISDRIIILLLGCHLFSDAECAEAFSSVHIQVFLGLLSDVLVDLLSLF